MSTSNWLEFAFQRITLSSGWIPLHSHNHLLYLIDENALTSSGYHSLPLAGLTWISYFFLICRCGGSGREFSKEEKKRLKSKASLRPCDRGEFHPWEHKTDHYVSQCWWEMLTGHTWHLFLFIASVPRMVSDSLKYKKRRISCARKNKKKKEENSSSIS